MRTFTLIITLILISIILFLLYHINNKKYENITGLGEKQELSENLNKSKKYTRRTYN